MNTQPLPVIDTTICDREPIHIPGSIQPHGVLLLGFTSAASTIAADRLQSRHGWKSMVSLGYDGIRFVAPVRIGDTITVRYRVAGKDDAKQRTTSEFEVVNQRGETVLVGRHIMKWFA